MKRSRRRLLKRLSYLTDPVVLTPLVLTALGYTTLRFAFTYTPSTVGEYWALVTALVAYLLLALLFNRMSRKRFRRRTAVVSDPEALEFRLYELSRSLGDAARSLKDIEKEILARESAARTLTAKTEQLSIAAEMNEYDATVIGDFLARKLDGRLRVMSLEAWIVFLIGIALSVPTGMLVNWLTN